MRKVFAIILCKIASYLSRIITKKEGSVIGGYWALKIYPDIMKHIKLPNIIIGITGSSGKGSTTELIAHILKKNNKTVIYNKTGSNALNGIISLILYNVNLKGILNVDVLLLELDERHMKGVYNYIIPTHLVVTNITRDQPPRNVHPEYIYSEINNVINDNIHLILNADDPLVKRLSLTHKGLITLYGMDNTNYSKESPLHNVDGAYCPKCKTKLKYYFYHYGHLGNYECPKCDFKRGDLNFLAHNVNLKNRTMYINKEKISLPSNFLYSVYFTTAAYSVCRILNIPKEKILYAINEDKLIPKRLNIYSIDNRKWQMLVSKNENNLSYKQSISYIVKEPGIKTVVLGFNNSSRRYAENDISWLWDIDFEELNDKKIDKIVIIGRFMYDVLTRLEYTGIDKDKIILLEDVENIIDVLKNKTKGNIYSMVCFDMEIILKKLLLDEVENEN